MERWCSGGWPGWLGWMLSGGGEWHCRSTAAALHLYRAASTTAAAAGIAARRCLAPALPGAARRYLPLLTPPLLPGPTTLLHPHSVMALTVAPACRVALPTVRRERCAAFAAPNAANCCACGGALGFNRHTHHKQGRAAGPAA